MKLPKSESLILFAFLVCLFLWGISKCSAKRSDLVRKMINFEADEGGEERPVRHDTVVAVAPQKPVEVTPQPVAVEPAPPPPPTQSTTTLRKPGADPTPTTPTNTAPTTAKPAAPAAKSSSTLYVSIDGLKVRKEPGLKGEALEQLPLYSPVTFLNQKTEWTQEISLGYEKVTDHWVKIRTGTGKVGWVFGAGLHYYKTKRSGVIPGKPAETTPKKKN